MLMNMVQSTKIFGENFIGIEKQELLASERAYPGQRLSDFYRNPNDYQSMGDRLHVCETLFGDFDAEIMILLQDAADTATIERQALEFPSSPLRHGNKVRTNIRLVNWFASLLQSDLIDINGSHASGCGIYYANAVWLIKRGDSMRAPIRAKKSVSQACLPVLHATIKNLSRLRLIITFGREAYTFLRNAYGLPLDWQSALSSQKPQMLANGIAVGAMNHPAASVPERESLARLGGILREGLPTR